MVGKLCHPGAQCHPGASQGRVAIALLIFWGLYFLVLPAQARTSEEYAYLGGRAEKIFECSIYAAYAWHGIDEDKSNRLFTHGYGVALQFIDAYKSGRFKDSDTFYLNDPISSIVFLKTKGFIKELSEDFVVGIIYKISDKEARSNIEFSGELREAKIQARKMYDLKNCALINAE